MGSAKEDLWIMVVDEGAGDYYAIWDESVRSIIAGFWTQAEAETFLVNAQAYEKKLAAGGD